MNRSDMPTMTAAELHTMIAEWQESARRDSEGMAAAIEGLTGVRQDFGPGRPVPVCPTCAWESTRKDQSDFQIIGHDTDRPRILFGCGHGWDITEIPAMKTKFVDEVCEYLGKHGITVRRTEVAGPESAVFHVSAEDRAKAHSKQADIERDLNAYMAVDDSHGMSVIIVEREGPDE